VPKQRRGEAQSVENLRHLKSTDEIKFVLGTREDYEWAKEKMASTSWRSSAHC